MHITKSTPLQSHTLVLDFVDSLSESESDRGMIIFAQSPMEVLGRAMGMVAIRLVEGVQLLCAVRPSPSQVWFMARS